MGFSFAHCKILRDVVIKNAVYVSHAVILLGSKSIVHIHSHVPIIALEGSLESKEALETIFFCSWLGTCSLKVTKKQHMELIHRGRPKGRDNFSALGN